MKKFKLIILIIFLIFSNCDGDNDPAFVKYNTGTIVDITEYRGLCIVRVQFPKIINNESSNQWFEMPCDSIRIGGKVKLISL